MSSNDSKDKPTPVSSEHAIIPLPPAPLVRVQHSLDLVKGILTESRLSSLFPQPAKLIPFRKGNKFGFVDWSASWVVDPIYEVTSQVESGVARVGKFDTKRNQMTYGLVDLFGREIVRCQYDHILDFREGVAPVQRNGKWGFIDTAGQQVVDFLFDDVSSMSEGLIGVKHDEQWGFIDPSGREIISCQFYAVGTFSCGLAWIQHEGDYSDSAYSYIDKSGSVIYQARDGDYSERYADEFPNQYSEDVVRVNRIRLGSYGEITSRDGYFVDKAGSPYVTIYPTEARSFLGLLAHQNDIFLQRKYDWVSSFSQGRCAVCQGEKYGYIDRSGKEIIPCRYDFASDFAEGLAGIQINRLWGVIDISGSEIVSPRYDAVSPFSEGLASVRRNHLWGFIDASGREVISTRYDYESSAPFPNFRAGLCNVCRGSVGFYIDASGHEYYEP